MLIFSLRYRRHSTALLIVAGLLLLVSGCDGLQVTQYYQEGALATGAPLATAMGKEVFKRGGNAFDVAVTVGFVLAVVHPQAGNIGGGGFAVIRAGRTGQIRALDFREEAPLAANEATFLDDSGAVIDQASTVGALAAGVPGTVAGLHELWERYGSLPWSDLVRIAADLADTGFVVDEYRSSVFAYYQDQLAEFEETSEIFLPDGNPPEPGDRMIQKDLASTLYSIASDAREGFYEGSVADMIVATMHKHGGLVTPDDLTRYQPIWRDPIRFSLDSLEIYSMSPPSSGGILLGQIIKLLEPYDLSKYSPMSPEYIHLFAEASRLAFADRSVHLGDPEFWEIPPGLLDDHYLSERRAAIDPRHASTSQQIGPGGPSIHESDETTHFSVCDSEGNVVALTYTLNTNFGSKLVVDGAGFLLNNEMDDFALKPGHANTWGLVGAEGNKVEPGKRMLSSMTPTIVLKHGRPYLVLGSPGGSKIITTVAQAILNLVRFKLTPHETVTQPRFHHQWLPDQIYLEEGAFDVGIQQKLIEYGHFVKERTAFGDLQLIHVDPTGLMSAVSDNRRGGAAGGI